MKKFISVMLSLFIFVSSSVFCFADFGTTDSSNLSDIKSRLNQIWSAMPTYTQINGISSSLTTISNTLSTISSRLVEGNHSIAYLVDSIVSWMNPIYLRLQDILQATTDPAVNAITGLLGFPTTDSSTGTTTWNPYLRYLTDANTNVRMALGSTFDPITNAHSGLVDSNGSYSVVGSILPGSFTQGGFWWPGGSPLGNIALLLRYSQYNDAMMYSYRWQADLTGYDVSQTFKSWVDLTSASFTPNSSTNGIYTWLSKIQEPVARLSYVLASDERIEAQEAAAANEEAVVDNFIDSSGSGAASPSDISSVSGLSSGFKDNISTDANVSGIWNIFNSDNFGWFSQETADQLDTTGNNRTLRRSGSYPTPLLDQQTEDILKLIGGDDND